MTRLTAAAFACAIVFSGCFWATTKHEGQQIKKNVAKLDDRLKTQEETLGTKVEELKKVLDEATKLLARNSADLGAEVNSLVQENARLTGLVMEGKRYTDEVRKNAMADRKSYEERIDSLETRLAELEKQLNKGPRKSPGELFAEAKGLFDSGSYAKAAERFKSFVVAHGGNAKAPEAQYYRAEAHFKSGDKRRALGEFQKVFEKYPKSSRADDAMYRAGEVAENLKWCTDARAYFGLLRQKYPRSSFAKKAKAKDKTLKRNARNKKKCKS